MKNFLLTMFLTTFAAECASATIIPCSSVAGNQVQNCSFENNNVANSSTFTYSYNGLSASPWTFSGRTGVSGIGGSFGNGTTDGSYNAFLQQFGNEPTLSTISQPLTLAGNSNYTLSFSLAARLGYPADPIKVMFDGVLLASLTAASDTPATYAFTFNTGVTGAAGNLVFQSAAITSGDLDTVLDNVSVTTATAIAPEPGTWILMIAAAAMLAAALGIRRNFTPQSK